jgi:hypothetical protein
VVNVQSPTAHEPLTRRAVRRRRVAAALVVPLAAVTLIVIALAGPQPVVAGETDGAVFKIIGDTDPHLALSDYQQLILAKKEADVAALFATGLWAPDAGAEPAGSTSRAASASGADDVLPAGPIPTTDYLTKNQVAQVRSYWCGPATIREALGQLGFSITQAKAADELGTTTSGTPWSGGSTRTGFPMADVMNAHQSRNYYVPVSVPYPPGDTVIQQFKANLVATIYRYNSPVVGNAWTGPGSSYFLKGHPADREIKHWFDIRGYSGTGAYTLYEDSIANSECGISWAWRVPAYSSQASKEIVWIVSGRGYLW